MASEGGYRAVRAAQEAGVVGGFGSTLTYRVDPKFIDSHRSAKEAEGHSGMIPITIEA